MKNQRKGPTKTKEKLQKGTREEDGTKKKKSKKDAQKKRSRAKSNGMREQKCDAFLVFSLVVATRVDRVEPGFPRFAWGLPSFTGFLPSFTGFYLVLLGFT